MSCRLEVSTARDRVLSENALDISELVNGHIDVARIDVFDHPRWFTIVSSREYNTHHARISLEQ